MNIVEKWHGLPGNLDAALMYKTNEYLFFKHNNYWKYIGSELVYGYPKNITDMFIDVPNDIDAVFQSIQPPSFFFYFFKG